MGTTEAQLEERRSEALRLRVEGLSFRQIGRRLGVHHESARRYVLRRLKELAESDRELAASYRSVVMRRHEIVTAEAVRILLETEDDELRLKAADRVRRSQEAISRLLGLDEPVDLNIGTDGPLEVRFVDPDNTESE